MEKKQRVLRGHTRDPWPCCNTAADERWGRPKGTICDECKNLIATGKDAICQREDRSEGTYQWARMPHWWPQYYGPYEFRRSGTRTALANAMFHLVEAVTTPVHARWNAEHEGYVLECKDTHSEVRRIALRERRARDPRAPQRPRRGNLQSRWPRRTPRGRPRASGACCSSQPARCR